MVLRQDQEDGGGEEAAAAAERTRGLSNPGLGVAEERLLAVDTGRGHSQGGKAFLFVVGPPG